MFSVVLRRIVSSNIRFVSSKSQTILDSNVVLQYNWFERLSEIDLNQSSSSSKIAHRNLIQRVLFYLSNSVRKPLSAQVNQHIQNTFDHWTEKEFYDLISIMGAYGMQPVDVLYFLVELPSADKTILNVENLKKTFENLIQLKFDTTSRSILLSNDPHVIQYDLHYLRERVDVLRCYFTFREIVKLIRTHRKLFSESWSDLDYKINYLRISLFASTRDIVESGALAFPIDHIRQRCLFAIRSGVYKRVRREEQYLDQRRTNISLTEMFSSSVKSFVEKTSNNLLRVDDFQSFVDSLKFESFDDELEKFLTLETRRSKWGQHERFLERIERRHWIGEFDMFNVDQLENELEIFQSSTKNVFEENPTDFHRLSDFSADRHRRKKLRLNVAPDLRT